MIELRYLVRYELGHNEIDRRFGNVPKERVLQYRTRTFRVSSAGAVQLPLGEEWSEWRDVETVSE